VRVVEIEKLLEIFDEYEPDEWFENERELWLDLRLAVINAPSIDIQISQVVQGA
jgi:hypothetical protein